MDRRNFLHGAGAGVALAAASGVAVPAARAQTLRHADLRGPYLDLTTGEGNMMARARFDGNLDESKEKFAFGTGTVSAVVPGAAVRDLFGFEMYSVGRLKKQADGSFLWLHREVVYYTDLATGQVLTEYRNPYTDELVKVVDVVNDPWNEKFEAMIQPRPAYGGIIKPEDNKPRPFVMDWRLGSNGMATALRHVNIYYPATLTPDKWPRESAGTMNQVSEFFQFSAPIEDIQNENLTSVEYNGTWSRITPWLPWLLMGQSPGHIYYNSSYFATDDIDRMKPTVRAHTEKYHPQMMHAPTAWSEPSLSSLEDYARTQKPAPARKK